MSYPFLRVPTFVYKRSQPKQSKPFEKSIGYEPVGLWRLRGLGLRVGDLGVLGFGVREALGF